MKQIVFCFSITYLLFICSAFVWRFRNPQILLEHVLNTPELLQKNFQQKAERFFLQRSKIKCVLKLLAFSLALKYLSQIFETRAHLQTFFILSKILIHMCVFFNENVFYFISNSVKIKVCHRRRGSAFMDLHPKVYFWGRSQGHFRYTPGLLRFPLRHTLKVRLRDNSGTLQK